RPYTGKGAAEHTVLLAHRNARLVVGGTACLACVAFADGQHGPLFSPANRGCRFGEGLVVAWPEKKNMARVISAEAERFPIEGVFTISRGSKTEAEVITCTVREGDNAGCGECVP